MTSRDFYRKPRLLAVACVALVAFAATAQEPRKPDVPQVEEGEEPVGETIDEGSEANPGLERKPTIDAADVRGLLARGRVGLALRAQSEAQYETPNVAAGAREKIAALTRERIESATPEDGALTGYTANYEFRVSEEDAAFHLRHRSRRFSDVSRADRVAPGAIVERARRDLETLGIALARGMDLRVDVLQRRSSDAVDEPQDVAYKVFVDLSVAGSPVAGSQLVLSYYLDGMRHKVSARWPAVKGAAPATGLTLDGLTRQVFGALEGHPLSAIGGQLSAEAELRVVEGRLRSIVVVRGLLEGGSGKGRMGELEVLLEPSS